MFISQRFIWFLGVVCLASACSSTRSAVREQIDLAHDGGDHALAVAYSEALAARESSDETAKAASAADATRSLERWLREELDKVGALSDATAERRAGVLLGMRKRALGLEALSEAGAAFVRRRIDPELDALRKFWRAEVDRLEAAGERDRAAMLAGSIVSTLEDASFADRAQALARAAGEVHAARAASLTDPSVVGARWLAQRQARVFGVASPPVESQALEQAVSTDWTTSLDRECSDLASRVKGSLQRRDGRAAAIRIRVERCDSNLEEGSRTATARWTEKRSREVDVQRAVTVKKCTPTRTFHGRNCDTSYVNKTVTCRDVYSYGESCSDTTEYKTVREWQEYDEPMSQDYEIRWRRGRASVVLAGAITFDGREEPFRIEASEDTGLDEAYNHPRERDESFRIGASTALDAAVGRVFSELSSRAGTVRRSRAAEHREQAEAARLAGKPDLAEHLRVLAARLDDEQVSGLAGQVAAARGVPEKVTRSAINGHSFVPTVDLVWDATLAEISPSRASFDEAVLFKDAVEHATNTSSAGFGIGYQSVSEGAVRRHGFLFDVGVVFNPRLTGPWTGMWLFDLGIGAAGGVTLNGQTGVGLAINGLGATFGPVVTALGVMQQVDDDGRVSQPALGQSVGLSAGLRFAWAAGPVKLEALAQRARRTGGLPVMDHARARLRLWFLLFQADVESYGPDATRLFVPELVRDGPVRWTATVGIGM